jgi:hypothetical protein
MDCGRVVEVSEETGRGLSAGSILKSATGRSHNVNGNSNLSTQAFVPSRAYALCTATLFLQPGYPISRVLIVPTATNRAATFETHPTALSTIVPKLHTTAYFSMDLLSGLRKGDTSRGGRAEFSWNDVKEDKDRENYLGHSLMAPVGRWQRGKDLNWYSKASKENAGTAEEKRLEEIRTIKQAEEDALAEALGIPPQLRQSRPVTQGESSKDVEVKIDDFDEHMETRGNGEVRRRRNGDHMGNGHRSATKTSRDKDRGRRERDHYRRWSRSRSSHGRSERDRRDRKHRHRRSRSGSARRIHQHHRDGDRSRRQTRDERSKSPRADRGIVDNSRDRPHR